MSIRDLALQQEAALAELEDKIAACERSGRDAQDVIAPGCVKTRRLWLGSREQLARAGLCHARIASINPPTPRMRITRFML